MNDVNLQRRREIWPGVAMGIGILLVVYGHAARGLERAGLPIDPDIFSFVDAVSYAFHMPLFFFVSGYWLTTRTRKCQRLWATGARTSSRPISARSP